MNEEGVELDWFWLEYELFWGEGIGGIIGAGWDNGFTGYKAVKLMAITEL